MTLLRVVVINKREVFAQSDGQRYVMTGVDACLQAYSRSDTIARIIAL